MVAVTKMRGVEGKILNVVIMSKPYQKLNYSVVLSNNIISNILRGTLKTNLTSRAKIENRSWFLSLAWFLTPISVLHASVTPV